MNKIESERKTVLAISINGEPLLSIHESQKDKFYKILYTLSKKYKLILITDMALCKVVKLVDEIGLDDGFVINNCGSSVYDIKNKKIVAVSNMKKSKILPIFRQALIAGDSVIIHTNKKIYIYTHYLKLLIYSKLAFKGIPIELIEEYDYGIKNLMRNKVESLEIINTFYDYTTVLTRNEKIHSICENEDLIYNEINPYRLLVVDSSINNAIDFVMELIDMKYSELYLINLTNIFHNQNITSSYEYNSSIFMEKVFEDRTFHIFEQELKNILIENSFLTFEEL